jgi:hypothetical protein
MKTPFAVLAKHRLERPRNVIAIFIIVLLLAPVEARAIGLGDILSLINTITGTLQDAVGSVLGEIQDVQTAINDYRQQIIWPVAELKRIKTFVGDTRSRYAGLMSQIESIRNNSASLQNPKQFESVLRGGGVKGPDQFAQLYTQVYASVPSANSARQIHRDMMDIDDALAMDALKTSVVSDQTTSQFLRLADSLEQESMNTAPGSAPILTAQARLADLTAQAQMAKLLAAELREEAAKLAHQNTLLKQSAAATRNLQNQIQQILKHP